MFYAIGNVGDSKKSDDTRVNNKKDPKECVIEITDADKPLSAFPTGKEGHVVCPIDEWRAGNSAYDILYSNEYVYDEEGAFESFGGKTYEFRYEMKNITDEQRQDNIDAWRELYTFIVTSTDEEFYTNLKKYFVVDSALYYYLFTERYTMVDNRAKNSFWHYGKVYISNEEAAVLGETEASYYIIDDEQAAFADGYRWDLTFGYDFDTCLGIDNTGKLVFPYGKEDTDYYRDGDPTSDYIFRVADSVFFCRLRDLFPAELQAMFKDREEDNAWSANSLIIQWDDCQAQFPEELWRLDYERKYYRTYLGLSIDNSICTADDRMTRGVDPSFLNSKFFGRKKYSRRAFETNNEIYFATKYFGNRALSDRFWIRGNVPIGSNITPNYSLTLVPYSDMYVCVQYTSTGTPIHKKVKAGETCVFESDAERMDFIYVFAASYIQEVGDLSRCYVGDNNFTSATRLQKLVIGSDQEGYENTFMKEITLANNPLLEYLDLKNVSGIDTVINVSGCSNLKELYAEGTNATGIIFANGGLLETAHLPSIGSLSMKNLSHIKDFSVDSYDNLQTLIIENVPTINTYEIVNNAPLLRIVRLVNLNWDNTYHIADATIFNRLLTLDGIDSSGYEIDNAVLTGVAYIALIKDREHYIYQQVWPDLDITANTIIEQFAVTFVNYDDSVLEVQYVDKGSYAIDPTTRTDSPIPTPTKESTISTDFTFNGWDTDLSAIQIFGTRTVKAQYTETVRQYQIKYVAKGTTLPGYPKTGSYGENIPYEGPIPTYTLEEGGYKYCLFNRWDKSGFLNGDFDENGIKTVTAIFDEFTYTGNETFAGRELKDLSPVEIYALTKLTEPVDKELIDFGMEVETGDDFNFTMGYDIDYDDIESEEIITQKTIYDGTTYFDTGIKLFDEDKDFVLALDYKISSDNASGATLMQCFQSSGANGFKLNYTTSPQFTWGSSSSTPSSADDREMIIIRHKKGDNSLYVYNSNLSGDSLTVTTINKTTTTQSDTATLVLGAAKQDSGRFTNHAIGEINWCKIWYKDLGEDICKKLAGWTHEEIHLEVSGFYRYQLYDDNTKETMMSLLATHLLANKRQYNTSGTSAGGWAACVLNNFLNSRFYEAIPDQIKGLLKNMSVSSTIGQMSTDISSSGCYIAVPAPADLDVNYIDTYRSEVYDANGTISYMVDDDDRKRAFIDGDYNSYWTRSPDIRYASYIHNVTETGNIYSFINANAKLGVLIEISF